MAEKEPQAQPSNQKTGNDYRFCVVASMKRADGYNRDIEQVVTSYDKAITLIGEIKNDPLASNIRLYQMKFMSKY